MPKVSVFMVTYNHERFVEQAIRSVMQQQTTFEYELVIGEDKSTDRTREIVLQLKAEFPDKIRLILQPHNKGAMRNALDTWAACSGDYIAWLDGDDYWTSPYKLQNQVQLMERHPECTLCYHMTAVVSDNTPENTHQNSINGTTQVVSFEEAVFGYAYNSCSVMVRRIYETLPTWFSKLQAVLDRPLFAVHLERGIALGLESTQPLATYRLHSNGVWSGSNHSRIIRTCISYIDDWTLVDTHFHRRYHSHIVEEKSVLYWRIFGYYLETQQYTNARIYFRRYLVDCKPRLTLDIARIGLQLYLPVVYSLVHRYRKRYLRK